MKEVSLTVTDKGDVVFKKVTYKNTNRRHKEVQKPVNSEKVSLDQTLWYKL